MSPYPTPKSVPLNIASNTECDRPPSPVSAAFTELEGCLSVLREEVDMLCENISPVSMPQQEVPCKPDCVSQNVVPLAARLDEATRRVQLMSDKISKARKALAL